MKIKFNSDDGLSLKKTLKRHSIVKFVRHVAHEDKKYLSRVFQNMKE